MEADGAGGTRLTVAEIAALVGGAVIGPSAAALVVVAGVESIEHATAQQATFVASARHARAWKTSRAGTVLVSEKFASAVDDGSGRPAIVVPDADLAMIALLERFAPPDPLPAPGVHPTAWVDPSAALGAEVRVGPHVSIDARCTVGRDAVLHAGVRLYPDVRVGDASVLHANCVVRERCTLGRRVILHQNVSIGADGFGYRFDAGRGALRKVPQIGVVTIDDDVELGAGTCVDRAKFGATTIGAGTKIDNLVQVGHNCRIGRGCVIAGTAALAGSVVVGDGVQIAGGVGVADHVTIGDLAQIGAMSGVRDDIPARARVVGMPAVDAVVALRQAAALRKLPDWLRRAALREPNLPAGGPSDGPAQL